MKNATCKACTLALALGLTLGLAGLACASEGEGGQSTGANLAWRLVNLAIFLGIIWKAVGKQAIAYFVGRRSGIATELQNLEARKNEAERHLAEIEQRLSNMDAERKAILDESRTQGEAIKAALLAEAHKQADQIKEQAQRTAENEARALLADLRANIADEIVKTAEVMLRQRLDPATQEQLIDKSLSKVVLN